jgi:ribosomal protein S3
MLRGFYLGMELRDSSIISFFIVKHMANKRTQRYYMKGVSKLLLNFLPFIVKSTFLGFRITVCGKFQGRLRKKIFKEVAGHSSLITKSNFVHYDFKKMFSKFGVFSIKVWLFYLC